MLAVPPLLRRTRSTPVALGSGVAALGSDGPSRRSRGQLSFRIVVLARRWRHALSGQLRMSAQCGGTDDQGQGPASGRSARPARGFGRSSGGASLSRLAEIQSSGRSRLWTVVVWGLRIRLSDR